jgi:DNA-directed RNA polymerase subunit RPC12/RpoP
MSRPYTSGDFRCAHCHQIVSSVHLLSGVNNRNHCPYCLWSRHLDLYTAGDRLSACKAPMQPVALTAKHSRNKYGQGRGELMLVHQCSDCGGISINRIAADDDTHSLLGIFSASRTLPTRTRALLQSNGIEILPPEGLPQLQLQLFGSAAHIRLTEFA